jgi:hypothetical protein
MFPLIYKKKLLLKMEKSNIQLPSVYYEFREPNSIEETEELLKMRYATYKDTELEFLLKPNQAEIDLDFYDRYAIQV